MTASGLLPPTDRIEALWSDFKVTGDKNVDRISSTAAKEVAEDLSPHPVLRKRVLSLLVGSVAVRVGRNHA
jgi:hypothetical protein